MRNRDVVFTGHFQCVPRTQRLPIHGRGPRCDMHIGAATIGDGQARLLCTIEQTREQARILVHLSNFRPVKRIPDVIEIFDRVLKKIPSKLLLIGDGPDRSQAEWLAVQKGIHDHVLFLGKQDRVQEKLAVSDVMLLPSELESFGLAALEAMACEVVPIATRVGGLPEVVEHGVTGFLADVGDVDTMARHAIDLLGDESALRAMGKKAREGARARFCTSKIIPLYEDFYRKVLAQSR